MECTYILHINDSLNKRKVENSFGDIEDPTGWSYQLMNSNTKIEHK